MIRVHIRKAEWYPVFCIEEDRSLEPTYLDIEFSAKELERIRRAFEEFDACQQIIRERVDPFAGEKP